MNSLIQAQNISYSRQGNRILHNVDFTIDQGEFITVIGPNGAGKSTLLKILLGIEKPDTGKVLRQAGLTVGYTPQRIPVSSVLPMTVRYFLRLNKKVNEQVLEKSVQELVQTQWIF